MQVEALVPAYAPAKPGPGFPVSGWAAEPMRTPPKRAPVAWHDRRLWALYGADGVLAMSRQVTGRRRLTVGV